MGDLVVYADGFAHSRPVVLRLEMTYRCWPLGDTRCRRWAAKVTKLRPTA